jgi:hypothetical protein
MWRLWHRLFGWHYVHLTSPLGTALVRRVLLMPNGLRYVVWVGETFIFEDNDRWRARPLTWVPDPAATVGRWP